ncbi:MAG TPA: allantoicase [Polyangiaceae bacterium]|nr:allantoicase [Polyangiaceae bacterium]
MTAFDEFPNVASERLGAVALWASDDFFAEKENLLRDRPAEWREHDYTDRGKWMDGWESRRKRAIGPDVEDAAIVRLALPAVIRGIVVDTAFFRGNFPEQCILEGATAREGTLVADLLSDRTEWIEIVPKSALQGNHANVFSVASPIAFTHVRLRIFPDGGVARLRVHGAPAPDWLRVGGASNAFDLAALESGGSVLACSDMFFGPKHNLIQPGRARNMSDGWETKRRRGVTNETHDWVLVKLAGQGTIDRLELDTAFFLGNFPDTALVEGCDIAASAAEQMNGDPEKAPFRTLLPRTKLMGHTRHFFGPELAHRGPFTHLRMKVFPDGGVSRLRAFGKLTDAARDDAVSRLLASSSPNGRRAMLQACCASSRFIETLDEEQPWAKSDGRVLTRAREIVASLGEKDLLEAFAGHPRIGDRPKEAVSAQEQSRARAGSPETLAALADANRAYEEKHGFVFLIFAMGKSAEEILEAAKKRVQNTRDVELKAAAGELAAITVLRLRKLVT